MNFTGIILAAGLGSRLRDLSRERGKFLPTLAGRPMIHYAIDFMQALGAARIFVVGGYEFARLAALLEGSNVLLRENKNYEGKGNIFSLLAVLPEVSGSFLMMNVDHIYNRALAPVIRDQCQGITAFCDFDRQLGADDMKVSLISDFRFQISDLKSEIKNLKLSKMSKQLTKFHCGYVGMTYVDKEALPKYKKAAEDVFAIRGDQAVVENILVALAEQGERVSIGDISGHGWLEIDTPEEYHMAEQAILANPCRFLIV